jgi:Na+/proline symporter
MAMGIVLLALTGALGVTDSEQVMPVVLRDMLPTGIRGFVIAGLLAAFMSTFSSTVNSGASFLVRDIWQKFVRPRASERQAIRFSYMATLIVVGLGIAIGFQSRSIAEIWNWMMMALGAGMIVPNVLRWYWWRMNGWGYAWGTLGGLLLSLAAFFHKDLPDYILFPAIVAASALLSIVGSMKTSPVESRILRAFYASVRPFGFWGPVRRQLAPDHIPAGLKSEPYRIIFLNTLTGMLAVLALYLAPMFLVAHAYAKAGFWAAVGAACILVLRFTWFTRL